VSNYDLIIGTDFKKRPILWAHWRSNFRNQRCVIQENQSYKVYALINMIFFITYKTTDTVISFVFSSWIINEFLNTIDFSLIWKVYWINIAQPHCLLTQKMKIFLDNIDRKTVQNVFEPKNYHITFTYNIRLKNALSSLHFLLATCNPAVQLLGYDILNYTCLHYINGQRGIIWCIK
jgi:hypothetical protein